MTAWANESLRDSFDWQITRLYHKMIGGKYSLPEYFGPFVPHVHEGYFQSSKRVLVVLERAPRWIKLHDALEQRLFYNDLRSKAEKFITSNGLIKHPLKSLLFSLNNAFGFEEELELSWTTFFKIEEPGDYPAENDLAYRVLFLPFFSLLRDEIIQLKPDLVLFISDHRYDKYLQLILPLDSRELISSPVMGYEINEVARLTFKDKKAFDFPELDCFRLHCTDYSEAERLTEMVRALPT